MDRLEQTRIAALGIQVGRWRQSHAPTESGAEVRQDVAKQVGGHDHVQALGLADHAGAERVDQLLLGLELRVVGPDLGENVVPEDHVVLHRIRLGRARDLLMSVRAHVRAGGSPATVTLTGPATSIPLAIVMVVGYLVLAYSKA